MGTVEDIVAEALGLAGGNEKFVAGAELGARAHAVARVQGRNLRDELKASHRSMLDVLFGASRFEVVERPKTDFLVRLRQADDSQPAEVAEEAPKARQVAASQRLRADVYTAFTRTKKCYAFDRRTSGFYAVDPTYDVGGDENLIAVDAVELESLLKDRRDFAETLPEPLQEFAKAALAGEHPMTAFKTLLITHRSFEQWIVFHNQLLISRLRRWAERVGVGFSPTWLEGDAIAAKDNRFREAIENIITLMPDEELGEIRIPLKYIRLILPQ